MYKDQQLYVAHSAEGPIHIIGKMANRHGLIAGATGTGKTVTLQVLAETFSQAGVPCFMADMKGDLSGISQTGGLSKFIEKRCAEWGMDTTTLKFEGCRYVSTMYSANKGTRCGPPSKRWEPCSWLVSWT